MINKDMRHLKKKILSAVLCLCFGTFAQAEPAALSNRELAADEIKQIRALSRHLLISRVKEQTRLKERNQLLRRSVQSVQRVMRQLESSMLQPPILEAPDEINRATLGPFVKPQDIKVVINNSGEFKTLSKALDVPVSRYKAEEEPAASPNEIEKVPPPAVKHGLDKAIKTLESARMELVDSAQSGSYQAQAEQNLENVLGGMNGRSYQIVSGLFAEIEEKLRVMQRSENLDHAEIKALAKRLERKRLDLFEQKPEPGISSRSKHRKPQ